MKINTDMSRNIYIIPRVLIYEYDTIIKAVQQFTGISIFEAQFQIGDLGMF